MLGFIKTHRLAIDKSREREYYWDIMSQSLNNIDQVADDSSNSLLNLDRVEKAKQRIMQIVAECGFPTSNEEMPWILVASTEYDGQPVMHVTGLKKDMIEATAIISGEYGDRVNTAYLYTDESKKDDTLDLDVGTEGEAIQVLSTDEIVGMQENIFEPLYEHLVNGGMTESEKTAMENAIKTSMQNIGY
jgi:hypothetical protein